MRSTDLKNPDKVKKWKRAEYDRMMADTDKKLRHYLRASFNRALNINQKNGSGVRNLGCTVEEFKAYIEEQFEEGMSWENWGEWHLDHIVPLLSFDLTDKDQLMKACHFTNYQPLWAIDNLRKGDKV